LSLASRIKRLYLAHFSKPVAERQIHRLMARQAVRSIVQMGIGNGARAVRLARAARFYSPGQTIRFTGIDLFEGRGPQDKPGLTLRAAHKLLKPTGVQVQLVPGDPYSALARVANNLTGSDLVLVCADQDPLSLERAWFYFPRLLHKDSHVFAEEDCSAAEPLLRQVSRGEIDVLATPQVRRTAA